MDNEKQHSKSGAGPRKPNPKGFSDKGPRKPMLNGVVLECEPLRGGRNTNYIAFMNNMEPILASRYPEVNRLLQVRQEKDLYEGIKKAVEPARPNELYDGSEASKKLKDKYELDVKIYVDDRRLEAAKTEKIDNVLVQAYFLFKQHMTNESWEQVKTWKDWTWTHKVKVPDPTAGNPNNEKEIEETLTVESERNAFKLIQAIRATHSAFSVGSAGIDIDDTWRSYYDIRMQSNETAHQYLEFFQKKVATLRALGETPPSEAQLAMKYIRTLDESRYSELKEFYKQQALTKTGSYPLTLMDAYHIAFNHHQRPSRGKPTVQGVAFATESKPSSNPPQEKKNNHGNNNQKKKPWCFACQNNDHMTQNCPYVAEAKEKVEATTKKETKKFSNNVATIVSKPTESFTDWITTMKVLHSHYKKEEIGRKDIVLDSAANANICKEKSLLTNLHRADHNAEITGVNGETLVTDVIGTYPDGLGEAYYHPQASANLVSFDILEEKYNGLEYEKMKRFYLVNENGNEISFTKKKSSGEGKGFYIYTPPNKVEAQVSQVLEVKQVEAQVSTVEANKMKYTKEEVKAAEQAQEMIRRLGYPTREKAIEVIKTGAILNLPSTVQDVLMKWDIYGDDVPALKGRTVNQKGKTFKDIIVPPSKYRVQEIDVDIMFFDGLPFLISKSRQLHLIMVKDLHNDRSAKNIGSAIVSMARAYKARNFTVSRVYCDGESGVEASRDYLAEEGIDLELASAGKHQPRIERTIRTIKENMRVRLASLPFELPTSAMGYLANSAAFMINSIPHSSSYDKISPREHFWARRTDYQRDLRLAFGDLCQVWIPGIRSNDPRQPRTEAAIALNPIGDKKGSFYFLLLGSGKIVRRHQFKPVPMTVNDIMRLNELAQKSPARGRNDLTFTYDRHEDDNVSVSSQESTLEQVERYIEYIQQPVEELPPEENGLDLGDPEYDVSLELPEPESESEDSPEEDIDRTKVHPNSIIDPSRSRNPERLLRGRVPPRKFYGFRISIKKALQNWRDPALQAIIKEMMQMLDKDVFDAVDRDKLTKQQRKEIIRSFMFLKEKFKADGSFEKLKARLVAMGNMCDGTVLQVSSPTASLQAVLMVAGIAAREGRKVRTADVPGAYLNAEMLIDLLMDVEPLLAAILVHLRPSFASHINDDGSLTVKVKKAMYGHPHSAKRWFETLAKVLKDNGFKQNTVEECVFNKEIKGVQCTICVYVDDLMMTCINDEVLDEVEAMLAKNFEGTKASKGDKHSYLGMLFDFGVKGEVKITMEHYIRELLEKHEVKGTVSTPAKPNLFEIVDSPLLDPERKAIFHSAVATLLYLAKRVRPDILTAVSFLSTRVQNPTENDWKRLQRILQYLNGDPETGIVLKPGEGDLHITASADAAYGVHADGKSHSGLCIALGDGPVFVRSAKQKIVSKSSTEAELISLTDGCSQIIWSRDFLIAQGYNVGAATVYQDNKSTMDMVAAGKSTSDRTRHIHVRYFFVKDRVESGEIQIQHMPTDDMIADFLTKPLVGARFTKLKQKLLNWYY